RPEPRRAPGPARRADARREDAPHLPPHRARGATAARGGRAGGARRRPRGGARRAARALQPGRPFSRAAGDPARTARRAPRRVAGEWWSDGAFARDYFDLELTDGGIYRCFRENGRWFVDGVYD